MKVVTVLVLFEEGGYDCHEGIELEYIESEKIWEIFGRHHKQLVVELKDCLVDGELTCEEGVMVVMKAICQR